MAADDPETIDMYADIDAEVTQVRLLFSLLEKLFDFIYIISFIV